MAIDMYDTRTMLAALEKTFPPKTFLLDTFFSTVERSMSEYVDIDIYKRKRRLAPFVRPVAEGVVVERTGFKTQTFKPPYIKMKMETNSEDILKRQIGESIYVGNVSPADLAQRQLGKDLDELRDMIIRREEWMASQALTTGKITVSGEGIEAEIDFQMSADHIVTANPLWSDANADIVKDLRTWAQQIRKDSGLNPDVIILGSNVVPVFMDHDQIRRLFDNRRIDIGEINPDELPNGVSYIGIVRVPGITATIYSYDEWYLDSSDTLQPMIPADKVIMGSTQARAARHYGAIRNIKFPGPISVQYFPTSWITDDPAVRWLMIESAPLVVPHDIDAFLVATVL